MSESERLPKKPRLLSVVDHEKFHCVMRADDLETFKRDILNNECPILCDNLYANDTNDLTVLDYAIANGALKIVKYIVNELGYDVNALNNRGKNSLYFSIEYARGVMARFLVGAGIDTSVVIRKFGERRVAIVCGDLVKVKQLFDKSSRLGIYQFVQTAARAGWLPIVAYLLKRFKIRPSENTALVALEEAVETNHTQLVLWLVTKGKVDLSCIDLSFCVSSNTSPELLKWLLSHHGIEGRRTFFNLSLRSCMQGKCLKLNGANLGNSCCKLVEKLVCRNPFRLQFDELDLRDNPRIGKEGVDALIRFMDYNVC